MSSEAGKEPRPAYELLDFGNGGKLERFNSVVVDRESPSVGRARPTSSSWKSDLAFEDNAWSGVAEESWSCLMSNLQFELRPTPTGQVGVFPEQRFNWDWIAANGQSLAGLRAINLFGYTGGTTMALARQGVEVTHVDSAKSVVTWARKNAALNGLEDRPIRWIVDDAMSFVQREAKRENFYDIVVADPPSFGRALKKKTWKFDRDFDQLMDFLWQVCPKPRMVIFSGHTPGWSGMDLKRAIMTLFAVEDFEVDSGELYLDCVDGRRLPSGYFARFCRNA